ncbi:MAG: hypothetical protein K0U41_08895 [Gammaproteobacteria bacterium]|nr:hypothetical protein [Gammaproteobacteria bacterium]
MAISLEHATIVVSRTGEVVQGSWKNVLPNWRTFNFPDHINVQLERYEELVARWDAYATLINGDKAHELPCPTMGEDFFKQSLPDLIRGIQERLERVGL